MKIAIIIVAVLAAMVLVVALIGWSMPVKHHASREATFKTSTESLYATITKVDEFASWRSEVKRVEVLAPSIGKRSFRESGSNGDITYVVEEEQSPHRMVTRIADTGLPFGGRWTYELTPAAEGTALRITEDGEVYNPIFRFMSKYVFGHTATIDGYLRALGKKYGQPDILIR